MNDLVNQLLAALETADRTFDENGLLASHAARQEIRAALAAQPGAVPVDDTYPFYELRFIMRVLSHEGGAPRQDWQTAYGMAKAIFKKWHGDKLALLAAAPTGAKPAQQDAVDAALDYLDDLKDDAAAHIWPDDLERCQTSECVVQVASVRMGSPDGMTVPLFSREQVADAIRAAISAKKGQP